MPYATQADLVPLRLSEKDLSELTVDTPSGNPDTDAAVTASITSAALEEASGRVESYCRGRYQTPLQQSDDLKSLTLDITLYLLFSRRREKTVAQTVQDRFDQAISFLKDIASGKAFLDQPVSATAPQSTLAGPQVSHKDRHLRFSDRDLGGFV